MRENLRLQYQIFRINLRGLLWQVKVALSLFLLRRLIVPIYIRLTADDTVNVELHGITARNTHVYMENPFAERNTWHVR